MGLPEFKQHHTIWTPELVKLSMPLAGIARRCMARLIDQLLLLLIYALIITFGYMNLLGDKTASLVICLILIVLADFTYFWAFHTWMGGQTPGKKCLGIRVVTHRGGQINAVTALIRSLFNILDMLLFTGGVSALMILATDNEKRIADFTANTLVICDS